MRLILLGPPGAGKGTQAVHITERYHVPHVSTGNILRAGVQGGTELGRQAQVYMDRGDLVPDELVNEMLFARLDEDDAAGGFLLDGFPRNVEQVKRLDAYLEQRGEAIDAVLRYHAPQEVLLERILGRAREEGRSDDTEEIVRTRLEVYATQTAPLEALYAERGLIHQVDAVGKIDEVTRRTFAVLDQLDGTA